MKLTYHRAGDYELPDIRLSDPPDALPLGRYGMMHKEYLWKEKPALYSELLLTERLYPLCREIDETSRERLKRAGAHRREAEEVILAELVYN